LNSAQASNLRQNIKALWKAYFAPADVNHDGHITCVELTNHIRRVRLNEKKLNLFFA